MNLTKILAIIIFTFALTVSAFAADRALLIGIDHYQMVSETPGSVADAVSLAAFIEKKYKFSRESIHILTDSQATAKNIKTEIQTWLIDGTKPGDRVFFFYSGHGAQVDDDNGDEKDGLDEIIASYDINPGDETHQASNFIRDDEMNVFLLKLSGRRVVMAYDSCHSGTISRSVAPKSKYLSVKNNAPKVASRGMSDEPSYIPKDATKKDLSVVKEEFVDGKLNGIVIFSAAAPYQTAMWLKDKSRGAFAYSFEMAQKDAVDFPTAVELDRRIKDAMLNLKKNGLVATEQVPEMEVISQTKIDDKPLFGEIPNAAGVASNEEAAVLTALQNPLAEFKVKISIGSSSFKVGDNLTYSVEIKGLNPNEKAYLYILVFSKSPGGKKYVTSLFPSQIGNDFDNYLTNGTHAFPRKGQNSAEYVTVATEPGKDVFVAFVSKKKLNFGDKDEYSWEETYSRIGLDALKAQVETLTRSFGNRPILQGGDWQASSAVVYVK